jgi:hypothetical protein
MSRRIYPVKLFCYLILFSALMTACDAIPLSSITGTSLVAEAVLAKDFKADTATPMDVTTEYAPEQKNFHLVVTVNDAPKDTKFKTAWTALDIGGTIPPNTKLEERELIVTGSGTFEFTLGSKTSQWASGKYKVDLYTNNRLDRTINFTVAGTIAARVPTPIPTEVKCAAPTTSSIKPSGLITKVVMSDKIDAFGNATNPTTVFKSVNRVYAVISFKGVPANTRVKIRWLATDVGKAASCNTVLWDYEDKIEGAGNAVSYYDRTSPYPAGSYRAEIYLNDKFDQVVNFSVSQ